MKVKPTRIEMPWEWKEPGNWLRLRMFITGVLFPPTCFVGLYMGMPATLGTHWQSGDAEVYLAMLLTWGPMQVFIPVLLFSMLSMATWLCVPSSETRSFVRLGIYTGALLASIFLFAILFTSGPVTLVAGFFVTLFLIPGTWLVQLLVRRTRQIRIWEIFVLTTLAALLALLIRQVEQAPSIVELFTSIGGVIVMATPVLNWITYVRATLWLVRENSGDRVSRRNLFVWLFVWLVAFIATWRISILRLLEEYQKLPVAPPNNCYVSAASARGHRWLTGGSLTDVGLGDSAIVTRQMARLKFVEFALKGIWPRAHQIIRRIYDRIGPAFAERCRGSVWMADLGFVLCKPIELLAQTVFEVLYIDERQVIDAIAARPPKKHSEGPGKV